MFASRTIHTFPVTVAGKTPVAVTIHKLSGVDIEAAQYAHMAGIATGRGRNWAQKFVQMAAAGVATQKDAERIVTDPLSGYDRLELAQRGVKAWDARAEDGTAIEVTKAAIADLEDEPLEQIATEVLKLTKPALFQTPEEVAAARKND